MKQLIFSTGNANKFEIAVRACGRYNVTVVQQDVDVTEIQSEDPEKVALDKAAKAYAAISQPVIISDDSWSISGLNGFPGVYMHSINEWFTPQDFLRLTAPLKDRSVHLTQFLVFTDESGQKIFSRKTNGTLLTEARGTSKHPSHVVMTMDGDDGLSIAETFGQGSNNKSQAGSDVWEEFAEWYVNRAL